MTRRTLRYLIEAVSITLMSVAFRFAIGATATALVSVTILAPLSDGPGLILSAEQLDMLGKSHEELTIINHSDSWRELRIELLAQSGGMAVCSLHYSPMNATIPPGGMQVLRLMARPLDTQLCLEDHRLVISDPQAPGVPLFEVPVRTNMG